MRVRRVGEKVEVRIIRLRTEWWVRTWKDSLLWGGIDDYIRENV